MPIWQSTARTRRSQYIMTLRKPCLCLPSVGRSELTGRSSYVKGLPIKVRVDELNESGEAVTREILSSFQDTYTCEFEELYKCLVEGKSIKTSARDALDDLRLFDMMYKKYDQGQKIP
jgi:hypothetical protein